MNQNKLDIAFLGTPHIAAEVLQSLLDSKHNVCSVFTKPDAVSGRGQKIKSSPVKLVALEHQIPIFQPKNKLELEEEIKKLNPDLLVVVAYGLIITSETLDIPKYGALNIHASLLPKYRGASPISAAILAGDKETGISIIKITPGMDEGPILKLNDYKTEICTNETTEGLTKKLATLGALAIKEAIPKYTSGSLELLEQDNSLVSYCKMIKKEDGIIDFNKSASVIEREIRAYYPWPSSQLIFNHKKYKIHEAGKSDIKLKSGELKVQDKKLLLGLKDGTLEITRLQPEGKKAMSAQDFINGHTI